jgi:hypothetical protein
VDRRLYFSRAFGLSMPILGEPTSGLEPLTCSLRVRFGPLYISRKVAYLQGKVAAAYRRVTSDYAQVSVPVSVRQLLRGLEPATSSRATIRRTLLPKVADSCRIRLD